jgi:hypothetical protein
MVYLSAFMGLVCGFFLGQTVLGYMLRDYSKQELLEMMKDPVKRRKYGLLNWLFAVLGAVLFTYVYSAEFR